MTNATLPDALEQLMQEFRQAWDGRSDAERRSREEEIEASLRHRATEHRKRIDRMLDRAAVSGAVDPRHLATGLGAIDTQAALDEVVRGFDRRVVGDVWLWSMRASLRTPLLLNITADRTRLNEVLRDAAVVKTDAAGLKLRSLLGGTIPDISLSSERYPDPDEVCDRLASLQEWRQALDWVAPLPGFDAQAKEAAHSIAVLQRLAEWDRMLARGFVGRERQLQRLREFSFAPVEPGGPIPLIHVSGIGGAGKSTILAKLMRSCTETALTNGPFFIKIDFDQLSLRAGGEEALSFEVSRQLGLADWSAMGRFGSLRSEQQSRSHQADGFIIEKGLRSAEEFAEQAMNVVFDLGLDQRPVVLILDTFEEWQRPARDWEESAAAGGNIERLVEWIRGLRTKMGLNCLRIILSGRNQVDIADSRLRRSRRITLGPLPLTDRRKLLRRYRFTAQEVDQIARIAGGIPLSLHLAAMQLEGLSTKDRDAFLKNAPEQVGAVEESLRQGLLYDRFLNHVRNRDARKLAHPGLALRYVTPQLIREVLAGPCGIGEIDTDRAKQLFDLLSEEVWLVESRGDLLVHRPEVRRTMLKMMRADPEMAARVHAVHVAAVKWFQGEDTPNSVELLYHQIASLPDDADLPWLISWQESGFTLPGTLQALDDHADDFADRIRVQLNLLNGRVVPENEVRHLPPDSQEFARNRLARSLLDLGLAEKAIPLAKAQASEPGWYSEALIQTGDWRPISASNILGLAQSGAGWQRSAIDWRYPVMRAILTEEDSFALISVVRDIAEGTQQFDGSSSGLRDAIFFAATAHLSQYGEAELLRPLIDILQYGKLDPLRANNALRSLLVSATLDREQYFRELPPPGMFAAMFRPDERSFGLVLDALAPLFASDPSAHFEWFQPIMDMLASRASPSTVLLGQLGREFENVLLDLINSRSENPLLWTEAALRVATVLADGVEVPELRSAVRTGLAEAFPGSRGFDLLAQIAFEVLPLAPLDFEPQAFADRAVRRPREARTRLVEYIDRAGVMGVFLDRVMGLRPHELIARVRAGHVRIQGQMIELQNLAARGQAMG